MDNDVRLCYLDGIGTISRIAKKYCISHTSVINRAKRLGVYKRFTKKWTQEELNEVKESSKSLAELSKQFGVSKKAILDAKSR